MKPTDIDEPMVPWLSWYMIGGTRRRPTCRKLLEMAELRSRKERQQQAEASTFRQERRIASLRMAKAKKEHDELNQRAKVELGKVKQEYKRKFGKGVKGWKKCKASEEEGALVSGVDDRRNEGISEKDWALIGARGGARFDSEAGRRGKASRGCAGNTETDPATDTDSQQDHGTDASDDEEVWKNPKVSGALQGV